MATAAPPAAPDDAVVSAPPAEPATEPAHAPWSTVVGRLFAYLGIALVLALALVGALTMTRGTPVEYVIARGDPRGAPGRATRSSRAP